MLYGMTYADYWHGDPWMVVAYREAYMLKQRKKNEEMWIQGAYIANAVSVSINNSFSKRKIDYMKQPLDIYPKTKAEMQEEARQEKLKLIRQLSIMASKFKNKLKGTDENGKS